MLESNLMEPSQQPNQCRRRSLFAAITTLLIVTSSSNPSEAFTIDRLSQAKCSSIHLTTTNNDVSPTGLTAVAYKPMSFRLAKFAGATIPVACWFPIDNVSASSVLTPSTNVSYEHRISVRRIGQLLPNWDFIPSFVKKDFAMLPTADNVVDGRNVPLPSNKPIVLLAHGFLGSRFDLAHLAEALASEGFVCFAAEYPESLAASYERQEGLSRQLINNELLRIVKEHWKLQPCAYGVVGHSLGCGTVLEIGDETWARVFIAGYPRMRDGSPILRNGLQIASLNDGLVMMRNGSLRDFTDSDFELLKETENYKALPKRGALVFNRPDAPNHISFLTEGVNDAMIEFLSPLLPIAKVLDIPVLDFDRYQESRDSKPTASIVHPIIIQYLKQEMALY